MTDYTKQIKQYMEMEKKVLDQLSVDDISTVMNVLENARLSRKRIFICGNGGSASTAAHLECDFNKGISYDQEINVTDEGGQIENVVISKELNGGNQYRVVR